MKLKTLNAKPKRTKRKKKNYVPLKPESFLFGIDPREERVQNAVPRLVDALKDSDRTVRLFASQVLNDIQTK